MKTSLIFLTAIIVLTLLQWTIIFIGNCIPFSNDTNTNIIYKGIFHILIVSFVFSCLVGQIVSLKLEQLEFNISTDHDTSDQSI